MTAIEFFRKEHAKAVFNYRRAVERNATDSELTNLLDKAAFYLAAVNALKKVDVNNVERQV